MEKAGKKKLAKPTVIETFIWTTYMYVCGPYIYIYK